MRVVVDTNIWISYLFGNALDRLDEWLVSGDVQVVTSAEQLEELLSVIARPKVRTRVSPAAIEEMLYLQARLTHVVQPRERITACRDPKDNFILEIAVAGAARYVVTGDEDLLALNPFRGIGIVTYRQFEQVLAARR